MKGLLTENNKQKHQFRNYYCAGCKQVKPCRTLWNEDWNYCCQCSYETEKQLWTNYLTYEKALSHEKQQSKEHQRNLSQLAKGKTIENRMEFTDWKKFYQQKSWGINLEEWLRSERVLPVDIQCAKQWREDKGHWPEKCRCLERKAQELHEYFTNCLERDKEKLEKCQCEVNPKVRTPYYDSENYGYAYCEICETRIIGAGKYGVIKNRNDPKFWGLNIKERVLCGNCLESKKERMTAIRRAKFNEYRKLGRL